MLDIMLIREKTDFVKQGCANKKNTVDIDAIIALDAKRREIIGEVEVLKSKRNKASEEIALLKKEKKDAAGLIADMKQVSDTIKQYDDQLKIVDEEIHTKMSWVPNLPHVGVPHGKSEADNVVAATWGENRVFDFEPKDHLTLGTALDIMDFARGAKISGSGFPVYKGKGALLERAIINFMLDTHTTKNSYCEIFPPFLVNRESLFGTGGLPKSLDQMYHMEEDDLFCVPTAEVPVTNMHRNEILTMAELPIRYCAYTACFRREAGAWGKDTRGFLRLHQFNKVELVKFATPETSYAELETLRADAEGILRALKLPYRVLSLCDADISFAAAKCYDLELWAPGEKRFLEVSSVSNFEDFQARRMNIRYRAAPHDKPQFVHTLNGSGVATARLLVAILETYQTKEGNITVPEVLRPYMHGMEEIRGE